MEPVSSLDQPKLVVSQYNDYQWSSMNPIVTLRPATAEDADLLWDLHLSALKPYISQTWGWDENFQLRYFREHFQPENNQIIEYQGADIGVLSVMITPLGYVLSNIEIFPQFQGLGIGTALIRDLLDEAQLRGLPVGLRILKVNPARSLYLRLGFFDVAETDTHYWMRMEGQPKSFLQPRWETQRVFLVAASEEHLQAVEMVYQENCGLGNGKDDLPNPVEQAQRFVRKTVLPAGGVAWRQNAFLIRDLEHRETVGLLGVYFGYPKLQTVYINTLSLRPAYQNRGLGHEITAELERLAEEQGYIESRVAVGLKNWGALRFWTTCGYSQITRIKGDRTFSPNSLANVELLKTFSVPPYSTVK